MRPVCLIVLSLLVLAACGSPKEEPQGEPIPTRTPATEAPAEGGRLTRSPNYDRLRRDYESLRTSHQTISAVWEALADNQQVQCGTYPEVLNPDSIPADSDVALEELPGLLRRAAIGIDQAVDLWKVECLNPRSNPSPDVIQEGLTITRTVGDALDQAQALLGSVE
jgi:hypothetical protein